MNPLTTPHAAPRRGDRSSSFACSFCSKVFGRASHRKRHELTHTLAARHQCSECGKDFLRSDALRRHELTHRSPEAGLMHQSNRACHSCAAARVKCFGGDQCVRCHQRGNACVYPHTSDTTARVAGLRTDDGTLNQIAMHASIIPPVDQIHPAFDSVALQALPVGRFDLDESYQQDFWNPDILASTNWLDSSMIESQSYTLSMQDYPAPLLASMAPGPSENIEDEVDEPEVDDAQVDEDMVTAALTRSGSPDRSADGDGGAFYVDGSRGRQPWTRKRKASSFGDATPATQMVAHSLETPSPLPHPKSKISLATTPYESLLAAYEHFCVDPNGMWMAFQPAPFLSIVNLEILVGTFFDRCISSTPILHSSLFESSSLHWPLVLATATLGAQCIKTESTPGFAASLHEFHRRVMQSFEEKGLSDQICDSTQRMTAIMMNMICNEHRGVEASLDSMCGRQRALGAIFYEASHEVLTRSPNTDQVIDTASWQAWRDREWCIRLAYFAWQIDCMMVYHADARSLLRLSDANVSLPCHERLWNAKNVEAWLAVSREQPKLLVPSPTLIDAVQDLYIEKAVARERGEFARVLIIHALLHRMWEVEYYLSNPLSHWEPVASRQNRSEVLPDDVWLPGNMTFTKWQNSTCDALDVLHWQANSTIALANGFEHPTILHLHIARIVCLVPYADIITLARHLAANNGSDHGASQDLLTRQEVISIQRWANGHQYKARLSVIHAGALLWHLRRFATDAFHEAPAVALATLTLWAFGTFADKHGPSRHANAIPRSERLRHSLAGTRSASNGRDSMCDSAEESSSRSEDESCPDMILLDRPADDELVQQFIRHGEAMEARLSGVGDLFASKGPDLILREGCKLLESKTRLCGIFEIWRALLLGLAS